jgi:hypothetical protein
MWILHGFSYGARDYVYGVDDSIRNYAFRASPPNIGEAPLLEGNTLPW